METDNCSLTVKEVATMLLRHSASIRDQLSTLRRQFLQDGDLPFTDEKDRIGHIRIQAGEKPPNKK